ncbi:MAG: sugar phosphate isomerase/epimerase family protein [Candidatus Dormiibacterota bacterium]
MTEQASSIRQGGIRLAFSTLGCPDWPLERVAEAAREYGYQGVELRLVDGELLTARPSAAERHRLRTVLGEVAVAAIDTSLRMAQAAEGWEDDLLGYCELARELGSDVVRVFGGAAEPGAANPAAAFVDRLRRAGEIAAPLGVRVALETHDDLSSAKTVAAVLAGVPAPSVAVLWDTHHPYRMGESPEEVWQLVGERVVYVHVKDAVPDPAERTGWKLVLLGEGEVPVRASLDVLRRHGYQGWVSVEWEKKWHPEIPEPEIALPQHADLLHQWLSPGDDRG